MLARRGRGVLPPTRAVTAAAEGEESRELLSASALLGLGSAAERAAAEAPHQRVAR